MVEEGGKLGKLHFGSPRPSFPLSASRLVSSLCLCVSIKNAFAAFAICNFTLCRRCPHSPLLPHPLPFACLHQSIYTVIPYHNGFTRLCIFIFFCSSWHLPDLLWVSFCVLLQLLDSFFRIRVPDEYLMPPSLFFLRSLSLCLHLLSSSISLLYCLKTPWAWAELGDALAKSWAALLDCCVAIQLLAPLHLTSPVLPLLVVLSWDVVSVLLVRQSVTRLSCGSAHCGLFAPLPSTPLLSCSLCFAWLLLAIPTLPFLLLISAPTLLFSLSLSHVCCLSSPWRVN